MWMIFVVWLYLYSVFTTMLRFHDLIVTPNDTNVSKYGVTYIIFQNYNVNNKRLYLSSKSSAHWLAWTGTFQLDILIQWTYET